MARQRETPAPTLPRAVVVHSLEQATAALAAAAALDQPITVISRHSAGSTIGPGFFAELMRQARAAVPAAQAIAVLDCQTAAGRAMAAVHGGMCDAIIYTGSYETFLKLADIAMEKGITMLDHRPEALDLWQRQDLEATVTAWLSRG